MSLTTFAQTTCALVRRDGPDLTQRQMALLLTVYLTPEAQTIRGLAHGLEISKPSVSRALDRLTEYQLIMRRTDPLDRRSVLVQRTAQGQAYIAELERLSAGHCHRVGAVA